MFKIVDSLDGFLFKVLQYKSCFDGRISFYDFKFSLDDVTFDLLSNSLIIKVSKSYHREDNKIWFDVNQVGIGTIGIGNSLKLWLRLDSGYTFKIMENDLIIRTIYISYELGDGEAVPEGYDFIYITMHTEQKQGV